MDRLVTDSHRLKLGVGRPPIGRTIADFILQPIDTTTWDTLTETVIAPLARSWPSLRMPQPQRHPVSTGRR